MCVHVGKLKCRLVAGGRIGVAEAEGFGERAIRVGDLSLVEPYPAKQQQRIGTLGPRVCVSGVRLGFEIAQGVIGHGVEEIEASDGIQVDPQVAQHEPHEILCLLALQARIIALPDCHCGKHGHGRHANAARRGDDSHASRVASHLALFDRVEFDSEKGGDELQPGVRFAVLAVAYVCGDRLDALRGQLTL
jgi:hypothetical protein